MVDASADKPRARKRRHRVVQAPPENVPETEVAPRGRLGILANLAKLLAFGVVLIGAVAGFAFGAHRFFTSTSRFAVEKVEIEGSRRFGDAQVLALAGISRGDNLFGLDLEQAERELTQNPWIESAQLTRRIPDSLEIRLTEHVAAALAALDGSLYLVTRDGLPIKPIQEGDDVDFPIVTGISKEALVADRARALERIADGIAILRRYQRLPVAKAYAPQEIHMSSDGNVSLTVGQRGISLHLGKGPFRQKMLMAARVVGKLRARGQSPSIIFLDNQAHPERVVVRMR